MDDTQVMLALYESVAAEGLWIGVEPHHFVDTGWYTQLVADYVQHTDALLLLADMEGVPVGWIAGAPAVESVVELGIGVIDGYRGAGVGSQMMAAAVEWARNSGAERIKVEVFPHNERAIALYQKFGFSEVDRRVGAHRRQTGDVWDGILMERAVDDAG